MDTNREIDSSIVAVLRWKFPHVSVNEPTWAKAKIVQELRRLDVGDIVLFPCDEYKRSSVVNAISLEKDREKSRGRVWRVTDDMFNGSTTVIRIA